MNKNINNIVELTEKELACVCGGFTKKEIEILVGIMKKHPKIDDRYIDWWKKQNPPTD